MTYLIGEMEKKSGEHGLEDRCYSHPSRIPRSWIVIILNILVSNG